MRLSDQSCCATAEVDTLPGCSQVAVIHSAFVVPNERRQGLGNKAHQERLEQLWGTLNYDAVLATVCSENLAEIKILERNGWELAGNFLSRKTQHEVLVYFRALTRSTLAKTYEDYVEEMDK